jgi:hypothetical protein
MPAGMKLAEALALRADAARRIEQLRGRVAASARCQEGEAPVAELRAEADDLARQLCEIDTVIQRANWEVDLLD